MPLGLWAGIALGLGWVLSLEGLVVLQRLGVAHLGQGLQVV